MSRMVAAGLGVTGSKPSTNPQNLADARAKLALHTKRVCVSARWSKDLQRMLFAGQEYFGRCQNLCMSGDATRLSGRDRMLFVLCGREAGTDKWNAMYGPPMVLSM